MNKIRIAKKSEVPGSYTDHVKENVQYMYMRYAGHYYPETLEDLRAIYDKCEEKFKNTLETFVEKAFPDDDKTIYKPLFKDLEILDEIDEWIEKYRFEKKDWVYSILFHNLATFTSKHIYKKAFFAPSSTEVTFEVIPQNIYRIPAWSPFWETLQEYKIRIAKNFTDYLNSSVNAAESEIQQTEYKSIKSLQTKRHRVLWLVLWNFGMSKDDLINFIHEYSKLKIDDVSTLNKLFQELKKLDLPVRKEKSGRKIEETIKGKNMLKKVKISSFEKEQQ